MLDGCYALGPAGTPGVSLWGIDLAQAPSVVAALLGRLSEAERLRITTLEVGAARRRFIVRRSALRALVGAATGTVPNEVAFLLGRDGKPSVAAPKGADRCHFNSSSAREVAVIAISAAGPIGIDVEWTQGTTPLDRVAARFFSESEREALAACPSARRREQFFRTWVRKEAFLKGLGDGISARIRVTRLGGAADFEAAAAVEDGWMVRDLAGLPAGYLASVATRAGHGAQTEPPDGGRQHHDSAGARAADHDAGIAVQPRH